MTREEILQIAKAYYTDKLHVEDIDKLLLEYCTEMNKPMNDSMVFVQLCKRTPFFNVIVSTALEYYQKKFTLSLLLTNYNEGFKSTVLLIY